MQEDNTKDGTFVADISIRGYGNLRLYAPTFSMTFELITVEQNSLNTVMLYLFKFLFE